MPLHALEAAELGSAVEGTCESTANERGEYVTTSAGLTIRIWDDREAGIRIVGEVLQSVGAPEGTRLRSATPPYEQIPLANP